MVWFAFVCLFMGLYCAGNGRGTEQETAVGLLEPSRFSRHRYDWCFPSLPRDIFECSFSISKGSFSSRVYSLPLSTDCISWTAFSRREIAQNHFCWWLVKEAHINSWETETRPGSLAEPLWEYGLQSLSWSWEPLALSSVKWTRDAAAAAAEGRNLVLCGALLVG